MLDLINLQHPFANKHCNNHHHHLTLKRVTVTEAVLLKAQCGISGGKSWMEYAIAQCEKEKEQNNKENDDEDL